LVQHKSAPIAIAVLPLNNLSEDPANDYFVDGLTDEIIRNLSIIEGLAVRSQTSAFAFKGKPRNVREVGSQLDVEYILEGSVQRSEQQLRINVRLVRVRDDIPLWSGKFDHELTDIFAGTRFPAVSLTACD
jgi:TolB-like protein